MTTVTGTLRDGKVEFHGPTPVEWVDGMEVHVTAEEEVESAESLEEWLTWFDEFQSMPRHDGDADELEKILRDTKEAQLKLLDEQRRKAEALFS